MTQNNTPQQNTEQEWEKYILTLLHAFANVVTDREGEVANINSSDFLTAAHSIKSFIREKIAEEREKVIRENRLCFECKRPFEHLFCPLCIQGYHYRRVKTY